MAAKKKAEEEPVVVAAPEPKKRVTPTVEEQYRRNLEIVMDRARGKTWPDIAELHGVSVRRARQIHTAWRAEYRTLRHHDPMEIVDDMLDGFTADLADLTKVVEKAPDGSPAQVGAINARRAVRKDILILLQAIGVMPNDLGTMRIHLETTVLVERVVAVFERFNLGEEVEDALIEELGGTKALEAANN